MNKTNTLFKTSNYEKYRDSLLEVFKKIPVLYLKQCYLFLYNMFPEVTKKTATGILLNMQYENYIVISANQLVFKEQYYEIITNDKFCNSLNMNARKEYKLGKLIDIYETVDHGNNDLEYKVTKSLTRQEFFELSDIKFIKELIDCFWVIIALLPNSVYFSTNVEQPFNMYYENFVVDEEKDSLLREFEKHYKEQPEFVYSFDDINAMFTDNFEENDIKNTEENSKEKESKPNSKDRDAKTKVVQLVRIGNANERARLLALEHLPPITDEEFRKHIVRIAVIDNPTHAQLIKKIGFKYIIALNQNEQKMLEILSPEQEQLVFKIAEDRDEETRWNDERSK